MIESATTALQGRFSVILGVATLSAILIVACEQPPTKEPTRDPTPRIQQPALRPRASTTAARVTPEAAQTAAAAMQPDAEASVFVQVAVGENHSCALQNSGRVQCWGSNDDGQLDVPEGLRFQQITAGYRFSCGIRADGGVSCWGQNDHRQNEAPDGRFDAIDAGWDHVCALREGSATCWGWNANERATPPPDVAFAAIGAGADYSCGLTLSGDLVCWGKNDRGQAESRSGPFDALAVGVIHTCVLGSDRRAICQGANKADERDAPATLFEEIAVGDAYTCGILPEGTVECFDGVANEAINVRLTAPPGLFTSIDAGWQTTCAIDRQGHVHCWNRSAAMTPTPPYDRLTLVEILSGHTFSTPTEIFAWPGGGLAVADREGLIKVHTKDSPAREILDMREMIASDGALNGLLGAAVDPEFTKLPFLYIYYTIRSDTEFGPKGMPKESVRISRLEVEDGVIDHFNELIIMEFSVNPRPIEGFDGGNHYGGAIRFGPDAMLYLSIGDSTCFDCPQKLDSLHGKIIRIDVRSASNQQPYRIPSDNPMLGIPGARPEIWAFGLRNPWRMAFDQREGTLWVADVGHDLQEEVNIATAGSNLGWPIYEGSSCLNFTKEVASFYGVASGYPCNEPNETTFPIYKYHIRNENCAIIGGVVYRGTEIPVLDGMYLFGDFCSGRVWALESDETTKWRLIQIADLDFPVSSFGTDAAGEVYVLTFGGPIFRLSEADPEAQLPSHTVATKTITPAPKTSP